MSARRFLVVAVPALAALLVLGGMWLYGRGYYLESLLVQVDDPRRELLRAGGDLGHFYGIVGTLLFLVNLAYLLRKHAGFMRGRGSLRGWMRVHVFSGLLGWGLVIFHGSFRMGGNDVKPAAAWSLLILVLSGVLGRYVYGLLPHSATGEEESEASVHARLARLRRSFRAGFPPEEQEAMVAEVSPYDRFRRARGPLLALLVLPSMPTWRIKSWMVLRWLRARLVAADAQRREKALAEASEILALGRQLAAVPIFQDVFLWWRALHRAFAIVMVLAMATHVGVALYYGFRWVF